MKSIGAPVFLIAVCASALPSNAAVFSFISGEYMATNDGQLATDPNDGSVLDPSQIIATDGFGDGDSSNTLDSVSASGGVTGGDAESGLFEVSLSGSTSADSTEGKLKAYVTGGVQAVAQEEGSSSTFVAGYVEARSSITETFRVNGTGTATFGVESTFDWSGDAFFISAITGIDATSSTFLDQTGSGFFTIDEFFLSGQSTTSGRVEDFFTTLSFEFENAVDFFLRITWSVGAELYLTSECSDTGTVDAVFAVETCGDPSTASAIDAFIKGGTLDNGQTAELYFLGSDGLTIAPLTEGFLANSALQAEKTGRVSVVPLPASAWLLLAGIGGLGALGRRKSTVLPS